MFIELSLDLLCPFLQKRIIALVFFYLVDLTFTSFLYLFKIGFVHKFFIFLAHNTKFFLHLLSFYFRCSDLLVSAQNQRLSFLFQFLFVLDLTIVQLFAQFRSLRSTMLSLQFCETVIESFHKCIKVHSFLLFLEELQLQVLALLFLLIRWLLSRTTLLGQEFQILIRVFNIFSSLVVSFILYLNLC